MSVPSTWAEAIGRLAALLRDPVEAEQWVRDAVEARWGVVTLGDLSRAERQVAFQKTAGVVLALEEEGVPEPLCGPEAGAPPRWLLFRDGSLEAATGRPGRRERVARAFARYFDGVAPDGPPWRVDASEALPSREEWAASADFGEALAAAAER